MRPRRTSTMWRGWARRARGPSGATSSGSATWRALGRCYEYGRGGRIRTEGRGVGGGPGSVVRRGGSRGLPEPWRGVYLRGGGEDYPRGGPALLRRVSARHGA